MPEKPTTAAGYPPDQVARVKAACLYLATKLGNGTLTEWAQKSEAAAEAKARTQDAKRQPCRRESPDLALDYWDNYWTQIAKN